MHIKDFEELLKKVDSDFYIENTKPDKCSLSHRRRFRKNKDSSGHIMSVPYRIYKLPNQEYQDWFGVRHRCIEEVLESLENRLFINRSEKLWIKSRL